MAFLRWAICGKEDSGKTDNTLSESKQARNLRGCLRLS